MGLFDDLLKKPPQTPGAIITSDTSDTSGSTGQQPAGQGSGQQDPVIKIEKTTEQSIATDSYSAATADTLAQVDTPPPPPPPEVTAISDASSILVSQTPQATQASQPSTPLVNGAPIMTTPEVQAPLAPVNSVAPEAPITPVAPPEPSTNTVDTPVDQNPVLESIETSTEESAPSLLNEATGSTEISVDNSESILETPLDTSDSSSTSLLFGMDDEKEETKAEEVTSSVFAHPEDYIRSSIDQLEEMIAKIEAAHNAKLDEASEYKSEKEHFAELESTAYADAEKLMTERAHADRMKEYFAEQLKEEEAMHPQVTATPKTTGSTTTQSDLYMYDEPPMMDDVTLVDDVSIDSSVETALTGLAVQNTVTSTIKTKPKAKTKKKEVEEETFSLI